MKFIIFLVSTLLHFVMVDNYIKNILNSESAMWGTIAIEWLLQRYRKKFIEMDGLGLGSFVVCFFLTPNFFILNF